MEQDQLQSYEGIWEKLSQVALKGAEYDSRERQPHPKCLKGTREILLNHIYGLLDNREKNRLVWLHGTAGVGKSAVAFTVAKRMTGLRMGEQVLHEMRLAGSFFFSRKHTKRCTTGYFFATLAYQLATNFPSIRDDVIRAIYRDPALLDPDKSLRHQRNALFLQPLRDLLLRLRGCPPLVFVIDALDECSPEVELSDLISLLGQTLSEPDLPAIHILLTSRSEAHISEALEEDEVHPLVCEIPMETPGERVEKTISLDGADIDDDIYVFLEHSFKKLQSRCSDFPLPTRDELTRLASRAGGRFIVASTMMNFIGDGYADPRDRLRIMLELTSELLPGTEVYKLYDRILATCADPRRAYLHLSVVAALADPLPISEVSKLLGPGQGKDVETVLLQLRSIIYIPPDSSLPMIIYDSSVREYVSQPSHCSLLQVQEIQSPHYLLANSSLRLMHEMLLESTALRDALSELKKQSQAIPSRDPDSLKQSLSFVVQPPEPIQVLTGLLWLRGDRNRDDEHWLETLDGRAWLETQKGRDWLQTENGNKCIENWMQTESWQDWLQNRDRGDWLKSQSARNWLETQKGRDWLSTQSGRDWLQTPTGRYWLQTPHGEVWQATPAASVWLTMEELSSVLGAMSVSKTVPELHLQSAFQVIQLFKSLPDFLMFPTFLALRNPHHSIYALPQARFSPDRETIDAMKAFTTFANEAKERSRSTSDALKYACQSWAFHLSRIPKSWDDSDMLPLKRVFKLFCDRNLISWLERQWCLNGLQSCLVILFEGEKLLKENSGQPIPGPQSSRPFPPLNMPNRYQGDTGAVAPQVSNYGDVRSPNATRPTEYAPYQIQASYTYPPAPDPRHHPNHLQLMHRSQHNSLPTTYSRQNNAQISMEPDYLENAPAGQYANQGSSRFALDSLQDLTNEIQGRPPLVTASGGLGEIWKCYLVKSNGTVQVAVKSIRAFESDDGAEMLRKTRRLRRELKVWGRLTHDCILPLWGVADNFGPYPAMVCPWVDNGALTVYLERHHDTLSPQDKFSILNDIALGLQYLHRESIVHGDLTGSNVLVHGNGRAILADFGLSTIVLEFVGLSYLTSTIGGNIRWAAAELFEEPDDDEAAVLLSTECDIYSFGSIFLQVLTCKVPYYNVKNDNVVLGQVIRGKKPEPPRESLLAHEHWVFIQRCWRPRAHRPSVENVVAFVTQERQVLSPYT